MEDALKHLDKLTHEEARMATAEDLRTTHTIDAGVTRVREQVPVVDDSVADVDDDKVAEVINGAQIFYSQAREMLNLNRSDGEEAKQATKQTANDIDHVKRSLPPNILFLRPIVFCR